MILAFEIAEGLRWVHYLRPGGTIIVNEQKIVPPDHDDGQVLLSREGREDDQGPRAEDEGHRRLRDREEARQPAPREHDSPRRPLATRSTSRSRSGSR